MRRDCAPFVGIVDADSGRFENSIKWHWNWYFKAVHTESVQKNLLEYVHLGDKTDEGQYKRLLWRNQTYILEMGKDVTGSGFCLIAGVSISGVELSVSATKESVN
jgi:hypothetical protein